MVGKGGIVKHLYILILSLAMLACREKRSETDMLGARTNARSGIFMHLRSEATTENFRKIANAGFGKVFFHVAGATELSWRYVSDRRGRRHITTEYDEAEVQRFLGLARAEGLTVVPWIEKFLEANISTSSLVDSLEDDYGLSKADYAPDKCHIGGETYFLNIANATVREAIVERIVRPVAMLARSLGSEFIHIDDWFRLTGKAACDEGMHPHLVTLARAIREKSGVQIDFSHLEPNYAKRAFNTDWPSFGFAKSLTTIQAYVDSSFSSYLSLAAPYAGVIVSAGTGSQMSVEQAIRRFKEARAAGKVVHVFSFNVLVQQGKVDSFFESVRESNSSRSPIATPPSSQECQPINAAGRAYLESCLTTGTMQTKSSTDSSLPRYYPVYLSNPATADGSGTDKVRAENIGLDKSVPVQRIQTCYDPTVGGHYARVRISDPALSSLDSKRDYWILLSHLECR